MDSMMKADGKNLKEWQKRRGLTNFEMAEHMDTSLRNYHNILNESTLSEEKKVLACKALMLPPDRLWPQTTPGGIGSLLEIDSSNKSTISNCEYIKKLADRKFPHVMIPLNNIPQLDRFIQNTYVGNSLTDTIENVLFSISDKAPLLSQLMETDPDDPIKKRPLLRGLAANLREIPRSRRVDEPGNQHTPFTENMEDLLQQISPNEQRLKKTINQLKELRKNNAQIFIGMVTDFCEHTVLFDGKPIPWQLTKRDLLIYFTHSSTPLVVHYEKEEPDLTQAQAERTLRGIVERYKSLDLDLKIMEPDEIKELDTELEHPIWKIYRDDRDHMRSEWRGIAKKPAEEEGPF